MLYEIQWSLDHKNYKNSVFQKSCFQGEQPNWPLEGKDEHACLQPAGSSDLRPKQPVVVDCHSDLHKSSSWLLGQEAVRWDKKHSALPKVVCLIIVLLFNSRHPTLEGWLGITLLSCALTKLICAIFEACICVFKEVQNTVSINWDFGFWGFFFCRFMYILTCLWSGQEVGFGLCRSSSWTIHASVCYRGSGTYSSYSLLVNTQPNHTMPASLTSISPARITGIHAIRFSFREVLATCLPKRCVQPTNHFVSEALLNRAHQSPRQKLVDFFSGWQGLGGVCRCPKDQLFVSSVQESSCLLFPDSEFGDKIPILMYVRYPVPFHV